MLQSYSISATNSDGIPGPQPLYKEAHDIESQESITDVIAVDFQLLRLSAGDLPGTDLHQGLAELLRPSGKLCSLYHYSVSCSVSSIDKKHVQGRKLVPDTHQSCPRLVSLNMHRCYRQIVAMYSLTQQKSCYVKMR